MKKRHVIYACIIAAGILFSCQSSSSPSGSAGTVENAAATKSTARGLELFQQRCEACHGLSGNYRNNNAANLQLTRADSLTIVNTIINGKGAMPMFGHVMPDSDLAQLELYVKTLRK